MRVLVTGSSGFLGTNLVEHLSHRDFEVQGWDIAAPKILRHKELWRPVNILDTDTVTKSMADYRPDVVFHLAARTDLDSNNIQEYSANSTGVSNIIQAAQGNCRRVIFASTRLVCRIGYEPGSETDYCPTTAYGASKVLGEKIIRNTATDFEWLIVRPTSHWGPWFHIPYRDFFNAVIDGKYFHQSGVNCIKSFGFSGNTSYQLEQLSRADNDLVHKKLFYLADNTPINVREFANEIQYEFGSRPIKEVPLSLLRIAARLGDFTKFVGIQHPPLTTFRLNNLVTDCTYDVEPLRRVIGNTLPFTIEDGIKQTKNWIEQFG